MPDFQQTNPSEVPPPLPAAWTALGVTRGFDAPPASKLNLLIASKPGRGKTTLVCSRPNSLVISFERSAHFVSKPRAAYMSVSSWPEYLAIKKLLEKERHNPTFDCVTFDKGDEALDIFDRHLSQEKSTDDRTYTTMAEYGAKGKGTVILGDFFIKQLVDLESWGYSWSVISHIYEKAVERLDGTSYDADRISLPPRLVRLLAGKADFICFMDYEEETTHQPVTKPKMVGGKPLLVNGKPKMITIRKPITITRHYISCSSGSIPEAKGRLPALKGKVPLDKVNGWDQLAAAYEEVRHQIQEENSTGSSKT